MGVRRAPRGMAHSRQAGLGHGPWRRQAQAHTLRTHRVPFWANTELGGRSASSLVTLATCSTCPGFLGVSDLSVCRRSTLMRPEYVHESICSTTWKHLQFNMEASAAPQEALEAKEALH